MKKRLNVLKRGMVMLFSIAFLVTNGNLPMVQAADNSIDPVVIPIEWPGEGQDANPNIQKAIDRAKSVKQPVVLEFEKDKVYHTYPETSYYNKGYYISNSQDEADNKRGERWTALYLQEMSNVTIEGNGAELMVHGVMTPILIDDCENIVIRNLNMDMARPTLSEFTVIEKGSQYIKVKVHEDSLYKLEDSNKDGKMDNIIWMGELTQDPNDAEDKRYWVYDEGYRYHNCTYSNAWLTYEYNPIKGTNIRYLWLNYGSEITDLGDNVLQINNPNQTYKEGCTYSTRDDTREQVGVFIHKSKDVTFDGCEFYFMHGLGFVGQRSENLTFKNLYCAPREGSGRVMASSNDFMQISGCKGNIIVEDSYFNGAHDDPINVHGTYLEIKEVKEEERKIKVQFMQGRSFGFEMYEPGDEIEFVNSSNMSSYQKNVVTAVEKSGNYQFWLTLADPLPSGIEVNEHVIENITWTPNVYYRRNLIEYAPTRGILVTTRGEVIIEENEWRGCNSPAVLLEGDTNEWFESGKCQNVTIRNNKFVNCNAPQIQTYPRTGTPSDTNNTFHSNIIIEGNEFVDGPAYQGAEIKMMSTKNISVLNNRFPSTGGRVTLQGCNGYSVHNNTNYRGMSVTASVNDKSLDKFEVHGVEGLAIGENATLGITVLGKSDYNSDLSGLSFSYASSDESVATIDVNGVIHAKKPGKTNITVIVRGYGNELAKTVTVPVSEEVYVEAESVDIQISDNFQIAVGGKAQLTATILPAAAWEDVRWKIEGDDSVASIDEITGELLATHVGRIVVTAYSKNNPSVKDTISVVLSEKESTATKDWEWIRENPTTHWVDENKALHIGLERGVHWTDTTSKNLLVVPVEATDFEIVTKMDFKPTGNYDEGGLHIYFNDDNFVTLTRKRHPTYNGNAGQNYQIFSMIVVNNNVPWESPSEKVVIDESGTNPIYLKLKKEGNNYSGYVSTDGSNWIAVYENKTVVFNSTPRVGLFGYLANGASGEIVFYDLKINGEVYDLSELGRAFYVREAKITDILMGIPREVAIGTAFENIQLPETVEVIWNNTHRETTTVEWSKDDYNANVSGTYTLTGIMVGIDDTFGETMKTPTIEIKVLADKSALHDVIAIAESKLQADYTEESWTVMWSALAEAKTLLESNDVAQTDVDRIVATLQEKINALIEIGSESMEPVTTPADTGESSGSNSTTEEAESETGASKPASKGCRSTIGLSVLTAMGCAANGFRKKREE